MESSNKLGATILLVLSTIGMLCLSACKSIPFTPHSHEEDFLTIGEGGGFAGVETSFHILRNGDVFRQIGQDTVLTQLEDIPQAQIRQALNNCEVFKLSDYTYSEPGNTYKFLTVHQAGKSNRIVWQRGDEKVKPICRQIYQLLNQSIHAK